MWGVGVRAAPLHPRWHGDEGFPSTRGTPKHPIAEQASLHPLNEGSCSHSTNWRLFPSPLISAGLMHLFPSSTAGEVADSPSACPQLSAAMRSLETCTFCFPATGHPQDPQDPQDPHFWAAPGSCAEGCGGPGSPSAASPLR